MSRLTEWINGKAYIINGEYDVTIGKSTKEAITKLAAYEDAEEEGRLIEFPVSIGDTLYYVPTWLTDKCIDEVVVKDYRLLKGNYMMIEVREKEPKKGLIEGYQNINIIGKCLFQTKEEAEAKLRELEDDNE